MIRSCLKEAVNETNRNVKFIKALLSEKDDAKVSLDYDHKITDLESAKDIVPHIIKTLDFAVVDTWKKVKLVFFKFIVVRQVIISILYVINRRIEKFEKLCPTRIRES